MQDMSEMFWGALSYNGHLRRVAQELWMILDKAHGDRVGDCRLESHRKHYFYKSHHHNSYHQDKWLVVEGTLSALVLPGKLTQR